MDASTAPASPAQPKVFIPQAMKDRLAESIYLKLISEAMFRKPELTLADLDYGYLSEVSFHAAERFYEVRPNIPFGPPRPRHLPYKRKLGPAAIGSTPEAPKLDAVTNA